MAKCGDRRLLDDPAWYIVHTGARLESRASENLARLGYFTYYPFDKVRRKRKRGHTQTVEWGERPYLNRYIFVRMRYADESFAEIEQTDGVSAVVRTRFNKAPIRMPNVLMNQLILSAQIRIGEEEKNRILGLMRQIVLDVDRNLVLYQNKTGRLLIRPASEQEAA